MYICTENTETTYYLTMIADILTWYGSLAPMMQVFWACAIVASAIFLIQMVLTMLGMDSNSVDVDFDMSDFNGAGDTTMDMGGGLSLFSIRNLVNFFMGFGWAGVSLDDTIGHNIWLVLVSVAVGICFVWMFFYIRKQTLRLESNGAFDIRRTLHKTANVYLRIPAGGAGRGKVQLSEGGSVQEVDALTDGPALANGTLVRVTEVIDSHTVRVEKV